MNQKIELSDFQRGRYALAPRIVLTPEGAKTDAVIAVQAGAILAVEPRQAFTAKFPDIPLTELKNCAVVPGMVDSHTHAGQTFGKSLICGEPMQIWRRIWLPLEDALDARASYLSAKWMFVEALRGGFTTVVNFNRNSFEQNDAVHEAADDTGIRLVSGVAASTDSPSAATVIESIKCHVSQCRGRSRISPSLCFGFYGASLEGLSLQDLSDIGRYCQEQGILLQMHSNEHFPDVHDCIVRFGKRPIELWDELGVLGEFTLLHHATLVSANEIELLKQRGAGVSYNPVASQWKGNAVAPALEYAHRGIRMGLGTDATRMDAFRNLDAAESCQRIAHGMSVLDFSCGGGWTWVDAGTRGGADACGLGKLTGALRAGMAADFLVLDMNHPELVPSWDFEWELVRMYNRDQIKVVVVEGKPVLADGRPIAWDLEAFLVEKEPVVQAIVAAAGVVRVHGPSRGRSPSSD